MPINSVAHQFLDAYEHNGTFDGGLSFRSALAKSKLDGSRDSLERIDYLLGKIHTKFKPSRIEFIQNPSNVNFLYLLSYYIGHVISCQTGARVQWYGYDEMLSVLPENEIFYHRGFATSISCIISGGTCRAGFYTPLTSIEAMLYEEHPVKSVAQSARAFF
jgi:hypothetical protein